MKGILDPPCDLDPVINEYANLQDQLAKIWCLAVVPSSHTDGLTPHCGKSYRRIPSTSMEIPDHLLRGEPVPIPMGPGDVLFMTKTTQHSSLNNLSNGIRWSFDIRYNPTGQPTGRSEYPGFVARSRSNPKSVLPNRDAWEALWVDASRKLAVTGRPKKKRWDLDDPCCA